VQQEQTRSTGMTASLSSENSDSEQSFQTVPDAQTLGFTAARQFRSSTQPTGVLGCCHPILPSLILWRTRTPASRPQARARRARDPARAGLSASGHSAVSVAHHGAAQDRRGCDGRGDASQVWSLVSSDAATHPNLHGWRPCCTAELHALKSVKLVLQPLN
jgi:hypothetical protein